jgi:signal transduction histidine kinase/ActR/RegA family two-component response regulator
MLDGSICKCTDDRAAGISLSLDHDTAESVRYAALESLHILHTIPEEAYDRIVRRVSEFFDVPVCLVSLAGKDEQWFKAKVGFEVDAVPREASFCQAALEQDDAYVVYDARLSARFSHHPIVVGDPAVRFYAGVPLFFEGRHKVGTLCILDNKPRMLDKRAIAALKDFAALVVDELHLRLRAIRLEAQLEIQRAAESAMLASQTARADFLAMVTHEVRAPLNAIAGMVTLMTTPGQPMPDGLGLDTLRDSTEHLVRLINEVLDLAKLEATGFPFINAPFNLRRELRCALAVVRPQALKKGLALELDIHASVPDVLLGDRTRFSQIMLNLLSNAIKFTDNGLVKVCVSTQDRLPTRTIVNFSVIDTGIGMDSDASSRLFKTFSQGTPQVNARYGGTGLGLAICQKLVEAMKGVLSVESTPGLGSQFTCQIPFEVSLGNNLLVPETVPAARAGTELILVADDDAISRKISKALLTRLGYRVEIVTNGREALEALRTKPFDVALLDIQMPDLDGYSLARELHSQPGFGAAVPLIALTGNSKPLDDSRVDLFADYLVKPVRAEALDLSIKKVLANRDLLVETAGVRQ